ncbi:hypothetical protein BJX63DRAFT_218526 [Aspergillus granulosus]|uniref:Zn(2)-C6 fungal-type domain-containing protein n=1 Tax=Aspergillus granulosus TaxID=176169 RepID=A0ABR4I1A5_9EURO
MSQQPPKSKPAGKRRKAFAPRSRTGCRSCRIRRIRCDESPGQCRNCTSAGWKCDGYDIHRLPWGYRTKAAVGASAGSSETPYIGLGSGSRLAIAMTSDEHRAFSHFQYHSVAHLTGLFDSPLWQQHVLQMCHADSAVFHAVIMLSAAHQECELNNMQLVDEAVQSHQVYQFSLQQSARAMRLLNQRLSSGSKDPELTRVVLLCCLLFVMAEVLLGRYETAWTHLRCGILVLEDKNTPSVEPSLAAIIRRLDLQAAIYGNSQQVLRIPLSPPPCQDLAPLEPFTTFIQLQSTVSTLLETAIPLIAACLSLSESGYQTNYARLSLSQARLLSRFSQFIPHFNRFVTLCSATLTPKQLHGLDLIRILISGTSLALKTSLMRDPLPESLLPEFLAVLEANEAYIARYTPANARAPGHTLRPTLTTDHGIIANIYTIATRAPGIPTRLRAIAILRAWPHYEGLHNSTFAALIAIHALKRHFHENGLDPGPALRTTKEEDAFKGQFLKGIQSGAGKKDVAPLIMARISTPSGG